MKPIICMGFIFPDLACSLSLDSAREDEGDGGLAASDRIGIGEEDLAALRAIARSRTEPASRVGRARMLLAYRENPSFFAVGRAVGVHHQTVSAVLSGRWPVVRWRRS